MSGLLKRWFGRKKKEAKWDNRAFDGRSQVPPDIPDFPDLEIIPSPGVVVGNSLAEIRESQRIYDEQRRRANEAAVLYGLTSASPPEYERGRTSGHDHRVHDSWSSSDQISTTPGTDHGNGCDTSSYSSSDTGSSSSCDSGGGGGGGGGGGSD